MVGFFAAPGYGSNVGLLYGGGTGLIVTQVIGAAAVFAWAFGAMVVQLLAYVVTTRLLRMSKDQIESNNSAFGGLLGAVSLSIGAINAACIS